MDAEAVLPTVALASACRKARRFMKTFETSLLKRLDS
jgi:hypothetical protein